MNEKTKKIGIIGGAVAVAAAGIMFTSSPKEENVKAGFIMEKQSDGQYTLYEDKNGKKGRLVGKDLSLEQSDQFRDDKMGRHKKE